MTTVSGSVTSATPSYSTVFKDEERLTTGYCRKLVTVTKTATMRIGTVLKIDSSNVGTALVDADADSTVTADLGVIVDDKIYSTATSDVAQIAVVFRGRVSVARNALHTVAAFDATSTTNMRAKLVAQGFQLLAGV